MADADKRSVSTDALETLGMIHFKPESRDAIHLAVIPVIAAEHLQPGQDITHIDGMAYGAHTRGIAPIGIADPFLPKTAAIKAGDQFWLVIYPRMITSLRHVWEHPAFPNEG